MGVYKLDTKDNFQRLKGETFKVSGLILKAAFLIDLFSKNQKCKRIFGFIELNEEVLEDVLHL